MLEMLRVRMLRSVPWFLLSGMTALCFLQGVPVQNGDPGFPKAMDNVTVRQGDSAILRCMLDNRVTRVAWLNRSSILYTGNDKWSIDPRVVLVANTKSQYSIEIQNVDIYDEGPYICSVQTDNHPKTSRVHLIVQVPPTIVEISSNIVVNEGNNVSLSCIATGRPEPVVNWRYLSPRVHGFMSEDEYLEITGITREQSGVYECSAANDVSSPDVRRVEVTVNYPPYILEARNIGVPLGHQGILHCEASAEPDAEFFWYKEDKRLSDSRKGVKVENRKSYSRVTFFNVSEQDYGNYTCVAMNRLGHSNASVILFEETTAVLTPPKDPNADDSTHTLKPGDFVLVKKFARKSPLDPRFEGPYQVLLTTSMSVKLEGRPTWIHASHYKRDAQALDKV